MWDNRFSNKGFEDLELIKAKDLGKGGYANVRMGRLRGDPTLYAVKIVDLSLLSTKEQDHMRQEIRAHAIMKHPNIIRFHFLLEDQEKLYMLLEYASNGDLYKVISKRGKVSETTACKIVAQVALALEYIHSKGILHRDLKPENILLDSNLVVKVSDFGWCGEYKRNLRSPGPGINGAPPQRMTFCGTYEYMAPEIIKGGHQDEKVDIWSLGILLYELVHGRTPFRSNSPLEIQENIIKGKFLVDTNVSPLAVDLIRRLLREDPRDRLDIKQMNLPNIEDFTLANYTGIEPYGNEDTYEEPLKQEFHHPMIEPQQTPTQLMRRLETDLRTTADTSSAQAKSDRANYRNMGSKSPTAKAKPLEQAQRVHSIERTLEKSRDEKKLRFEKMRSQLSGKSCSQITRAKTLNLKEMDLQALKSGDGNTNSSFNLTKATDSMNRSLLPSDQQEQTFVPLSVLLESNAAEADSPPKTNFLEVRSDKDRKSAVGKHLSQSKNLEQLINDGSRRNIPNFDGLLDRGLGGKQALTQSLTNQQGESRSDLGLGNASETERKAFLERPRDWKLAGSITSSGGKKNQHQQPSFANKSSSQVSDFSGGAKPKDDPAPLYSKDFNKSMLSRFKNYPLVKTQELSGSQQLQLERKTYEPFHNSSVLTQTTEGNLLHGLTHSPDSKISSVNTDRIKQAKVSANSSERTLKKQGSSASNKSISLIENLHSRLNRKFSNRSITKLADAKKELVGRRTGPGAADTSSRADSASSSTHKLASIGHLVSDLNIYSQPMKKEHSPAAHLHNSKHYYDRLSREGRKILGINRTHSNTGSVGRQSDSGSVGSVGRENPSLNIYRSKK